MKDIPQIHLVLLLVMHNQPDRVEVLNLNLFRLLQFDKIPLAISFDKGPVCAQVLNSEPHPYQILALLRFNFRLVLRVIF